MPTRNPETVSTGAPDPWLVDSAPLLAALPGPVLDLACGAGGNGLWLARAGHAVTGVDRSAAALQAAAAAASRTGLVVNLLARDLEREPLPAGPWGAVLVFHFLERALFPALPEVLAPGGVLVYKTHLAHPSRPPGARPRRAAFLLGSGELLAAFPGLVPLRYREWAAGGEAFAALVARRQPS